MKKYILIGLALLGLTSIMCGGVSIKSDQTYDPATASIVIYGKLITVRGSNSNSNTKIEYYLQKSKMKLYHLDVHNIPSVDHFVNKRVKVVVTKSRDRFGLGIYVVQSISINKEKPKQKYALKKEDAKKPWINILCKFSDIEDEPFDIAVYKDAFGDTYPYLGDYWRKTTYGYIDISGTVTMDHWVTMSHERGYYIKVSNGMERADLQKLRQDCLAASELSENELNKYYGTNLFFNERLDWASWAGGDTTWLANWAGDKLAVIAHEMGHCYGLLHSHGNYGEQYDSPWDVMSNPYINYDYSYAPHYFPPQHTISYYKQLLGAIDYKYQWNNTLYDARDGVEIVLANQENIPENNTSFLIANIFINNKHYTIEARDRIGYDSALPAKAVIIHEIKGKEAFIVDIDNNGDLSDGGTQWLPGETYTDDNNSFCIEVLEELDNGFRVRITTPLTKLIAPTKIEATDNYINKIHISWIPIGDATYYKVLRYDTLELNSTYQEFTTNNGQTSYDDTSVSDPGREYYYRVKACDDTGCSGVNENTYAYGKTLFEINASDGIYNGKVVVKFDADSSKTYTLFRRKQESNASYSRTTGNHSPLVDDDVEDDIKYEYYISYATSDGVRVDSEADTGYASNGVAIEKESSGGGCTYNPNTKGFDAGLMLMMLLSVLYPYRRKLYKQSN